MKTIAIVAILALIINGCGKQPTSSKTHFYTETKDNIKYEYRVKGNKKTLVTKTSYKNGKMDGVKISYCGKATRYICAKEHWRNGKREGMKFSYTKDGKISYKANFTNGKLNGYVEEWVCGNSTCTLYQTGTYVNGKKEGVHKRYWSDGQLQIYTHYIKDKPVGKYIYYDYNGEIQDYRIYKKDGTFIEKPTAAQKRRAAEEERKRKRRIKENLKKKPVVTSNISLQCSNGGGLSMSEMSSQVAIARGKGEGAALGYMMNNGNTVSIPKSTATNYCISNANSGSYSCTAAQAYVQGCMSKLGH